MNVCSLFCHPVCGSQVNAESLLDTWCWSPVKSIFGAIFSRTISLFFEIENFLLLKDQGFRLQTVQFDCSCRGEYKFRWGRIFCYQKETVKNTACVVTKLN